MKNNWAVLLLGILALAAFSKPATAQTQQDVRAVIFQKDSLFWQAYNRCDVPGMKQYFTDDVEFYHDKGGIMMGLAAVMATTEKNLCGKTGYRLRREAVPGTVQVFPMYSNGVVYGALISGEHRFYITDGGKPEYLDGQAKFTQLWVLRNGVWKMSRVLSYDHAPAQATK